MSKKSKINPANFILILLASLLLSITMFRSGLNYDFGLGFWGPNGHDGIWHISLINQLKQNIPPSNPIYSGTVLNNYHWGFDLIVALISNVLNIKSHFLYFQILPPIFSVLIGFLSFKLAFKLTKSQVVSFLFVFLNYFAGSFGWIVTLFKNQQIGGESLFWSMQSASTLLNPPFALSLIFILLGLLLWVSHHQSKSIKYPLLIGLIFGLLCGIKIYAGVLIGLGIFFYSIFCFFFKKEQFKFNFIICCTTALFSFLILFSLGVISGNQLLEFKPFWFTHSLIESIDKLFLPKLASFRFNQNNLIISIILEIFLIALFIIGNLGLRFLGFFNLTQKISQNKTKPIDILFIIVLFFSLLFPLLFVQKGTAWNTIQFFYYFLFITNFYFAQFLGHIWSKAKILVIVLVMLTSITTISTLRDYFGNPPPASLPKKEKNALDFLHQLPTGYILTFPYDKYQKNGLNTPIPLYKYETTAYVSAFSQKPVYLEDEMNLDITGFNWNERRQQEIKFFQSKDVFFARGFLLNNNINYIYLVDDQNLSLPPQDLQIDQIYNQDQIRIYQVRK